MVVDGGSWLAAALTEAARQLPWLLDSLSRRNSAGHCPHLTCPACPALPEVNLRCPECPVLPELNLTGICDSPDNEYLLLIVGALSVSGFWTGVAIGLGSGWVCLKRRNSDGYDSGRGSPRAGWRRGGGVLETGAAR